MTKMKVALIGKMPANAYSGGRTHALILAEALAHMGNAVYIITNNIPIFVKDYECYPCHKCIKFILTDDFYEIDIDESCFDYVICFPGIGMGREFYQAFIDFSIMKSARMSFINYETPNWYEKYTDIKRPIEDYECLKNLCQYGCLVLSSAYESQKFAKEYYNCFLDTTEFCVWSPPINSVVADLVPVQKRSNQIIVFTRIMDSHKGGEDFLTILGEYLRGWSVLIISGVDVPREFEQKAVERAEKYGIILKVKNRMSDRQKFTEIKKSKIILFPSHFEGYGTPPVEALYCGAKCIVYALPVLKEVSGDNLTYCEMGNVLGIREKLEALLKEEEFSCIKVRSASFEDQAPKLHALLEENLQNGKFHLNMLNKICRKSMAWIRKKYHFILQDINRELPNIIKYCIDNNVKISNQLNEEDEVWDKVKKKLEGKKIYIWGTGHAYNEIIPLYRRKLNVCGILDSNMEKKGQRARIFKNLFIASPDILSHYSKDDLAVIIAVKEHVDEIIERLKKLGIENYHSICMIEMNSKRARKYKRLNEMNRDSVGRK